MTELKQEWTGYASGAHGGASGWFPQIKNEVTPKTSKPVKRKKAKKSNKMAGASSSYREKT
jgi:hypothetical protein|tara:strand:- start:31 stop:213 length:183 start_codon:yes stop_codon:yes gene_type:complete